MASDHERNCNGGPDGPWCGRPATHVRTEDDGLQCFTCAEHKGAQHEPLESWLKRLKRSEVMREIGGPWRCRCGGQVTAVSSEAADGIVHSMPFCEDFSRIDSPIAFLRWLRTGFSEDA